MKKNKTAVAIALALTLATGLVPNSAFAKKVSQSAPIIETTTSDPIYLCPSLASDNASSEVTGYMFRGLIQRDWNFKFKPDIAAAMPTISKDSKTITFKLRKDVKWHDGKPLTSADVKFSYDFILNKATNSPRYSAFSAISKITTPDPYTVVFNLSKVDAAIYNQFQFGYIIPKHLWEKVDPATARQSELNRKPIGNGPYKLKEWRSGERVVLEANPNFYDKKPNVDTIIRLTTPSTATELVKLETGEANSVKIPEADLARMKTKSNLNVYTFDKATIDCIQYNTKSPFFGDKRVRQAMTYAINKKALINGLYKGVAKVADGSYHPKFAVYEPNVKKYNYDINMSKKLLDQAGWKVGKDGIREKNGKKLEFEIFTNKGNSIREKMVVVVQSQLKLVGVKASPRIMDWNTLVTKHLDTRKFDAVVSGYNLGLDGDQTVFYNSDKNLGYFNKGSYNNPKIDKLLNDAKGTFDLGKQKTIYSEVQKILAEDQPMTYIAYRKGALGFNKKVKGVKVVDLLGAHTSYMTYTVDK